MSSSKVKDIKAFVTLEKELKLFDRTYCGLPYWDAIRFYVCEAVFTDKYSVKQKNAKKSNKILNKIKQIKASCEFQLIRENDILIFSWSKLHYRFFRYLNIPNSLKYAIIKIKNKDTKFLNSHVIYFTAKHGIYNALLMNDPKEISFLNELSQRLKDQFGQAPSVEQINLKIINYLKKRNNNIKYFKELLTKTKCRLIVLTFYYNDTYYYLIEAAHTLGIPVVELQHGVANNHIAYTFEDRTKTYEHLPDYFFTFGEIHSSWVRLPESVKVIATGNAYQENIIKEFENIIPDEKLIIVYPKLSEVFETMICELADSITTKGYKVIVKMHPGESENYKEYYPIIAANTNLTIETGKDKSIYYWLHSACHHVMASSTVGMEALVYDHTNIYIAENVEHAQVQCLLDADVAYGFKSAKELESLIINSDKKHEGFNRESFWKSNATNNIKNEIERILSCKDN